MDRMILSIIFSLLILRIRILGGNTRYTHDSLDSDEMLLYNTPSARQAFFRIVLWIILDINSIFDCLQTVFR